MVNALITGGADVNICDLHGNTALHMAAKNGHPEVVNALIIGGADVNIRNIHGKTALHMAAENGHQEVVNLLTSLEFRVRRL